MVDRPNLCLAVWLGEGAASGNKALVDLGASPVESLDKILEVRASSVGDPVEGTAQLRFWM